MSLNVKIKGQGHQGQKTHLVLPSPVAAYEWYWYTLAANSMQQQRKTPVHAGGDFGGLVAVLCLVKRL